MRGVVVVPALVIALVGCGGPRGTRTGKGTGGGDGAGSGGREIGVWSFLLHAQLASRTHATRIQLKENTVVPPCGLDVARLRSEFPRIDPDTVTDFLKQLPRPRVLHAQVRGGLRLELVGGAQAATHAKSGVLGQRAPDSAGLIEVSRVGFGAGRKDALVYFREVSLPGALIHLRWDKQWTEVTRVACQR